MMMRVKKKAGKIVQAFQLGKKDKLEEQLIAQGKLRCAGEEYEVFSRESLAGQQKGEKACTGDYVKFDEGGYPYPNTKEFFEKNHRQIGKNLYEQFSRPLWAWKFIENEEWSKEIQFLKEKKGLLINEASYEEYMKAPLWGTVLTANKDAVIIFYKIERDTKGEILDEEFNFCAWEEFQKTYDVLEVTDESSVIF